MASHSDSEDEGFYKPTIQITQPMTEVHTELASIDDSFEGPIDIVTEGRPTDFKPRFLNLSTSYYTPHYVINQSICHDAGEYMEPIYPQKVSNKANKPSKQKRYDSLESKYKNNPNFELVYSKIPQNAEYSSYIFSLEGTPDYNPNNFVLADKTLPPSQSIFDSRFQSGNLLYAYKRQKQAIEIPEYDLIMQNDTNTKGYCQWFFFSVRNKQEKRIKINIVNFIKKELMFINGARPVSLSIKSSETGGAGWKFVGQNINYGKSYITRQIAGNPPLYKNYYCLSFELTFEHPQDLVYVALNFPYTYTKMLQYTQSLIQAAKLCEDISIERKILCYSISNNPIPYLIIEHKEIKSRKTILCLGRQHPGQIVGSYTLEGFISNLITKKKLLEEYRFVVVPMINPDGVIYGNFRTNLGGFDLNRQWTTPNRWLHPEVFFLRRLVSSIQNLQFCIDFHGHSKKLNAFIYACIDERVNEFRIYPYIMSQLCEFFSLKDCTFNISPDKVRTARVNVFNLIKKPYVFTLETSSFGHSEGNRNKRFVIKDLQMIGKCAADSLEMLLINKAMRVEMQKGIKVNGLMFEQWALQNKEDEGSESNPSQDQLTPMERRIKVMSEQREKKLYAKLQKPKSKTRKKQKSHKKKKQSMQFLSNYKQQAAYDIEKRQSSKLILPNPTEKETDETVIIPGKSKKMKSEVRREKSFQSTQPKQNTQSNQNNLVPNIQKSQIARVISKAQNKQIANNIINSNLFDSSNYIKIRQQINNQLKRSQERKLQIYNYKLEVNKKNVEEQNFTKFNKARAERLKKEFEELAPVYSQPKKNKERIYVIKENKVVRSFTRIKQVEGKKNLEKEVNNRTMEMKNNEKFMVNLRIRGNRNPREYILDKGEQIQEEDPYKTKKLLKPLSIKQHRSYNDFKGDEKCNIFFSFLDG